MGVILVDVCLMFRDATIKRYPVRVFLIWVIFADAVLCTKSSLRVLIHIILFFHRDGHQRRTRYGFLISLHLLFTSNFQLVSRMPSIFLCLTLSFTRQCSRLPRSKALGGSITLCYGVTKNEVYAHAQAFVCNIGFSLFLLWFIVNCFCIAYYFQWYHLLW